MKIFLILLLSVSAYAQSLTKSGAESFINALLNESEDIYNYVDPEEISMSERLGINYTGVKFKPLISIDINPQIKSGILNQQLKYNYNIVPLEEDFSKLVITIKDKELSYEYVFNKAKLISKPVYYAKDQVKLRSKYFIFHLSDPSLLNDYAIDKMDKLVDQTLDLLSCGAKEKEILEEAKIHYFLCRDQADILKVTGYEARGLYYLANDFIISTYNAHYHEITHLLINYKLKTLRLYAQPIFQEGFAAAFGGRGGKEPGVILNMGAFLVKSSFLNYDKLLSVDKFSNYDASMTYPVAGLYTKFLITTIGIQKFLELYQKYSYSSYKSGPRQIEPDDLPDDSLWRNFIDQYANLCEINVSDFKKEDFPQQLIKNDTVEVHSNEEAFLIKIKKNISFFAGNIKNYRSSLFEKLIPDFKYRGEKYHITANAEEVSIYNFWTNSLIAKYVRGFTIDGKQVQQREGFFIFSVSKKIFDENLKDLRITNNGV